MKPLYTEVFTLKISGTQKRTLDDAIKELLQILIQFNKKGFTLNK